MDYTKPVDTSGVANAFIHGRAVANQNEQAKATNALQQQQRDLQASKQGYEEPYYQAHTADMQAQAQQRTIASLAGPIEGLAKSYEAAKKKDPETASSVIAPYYHPLRDTLRQAGIQVPDEYDDTTHQMAMGVINKNKPPKPQITTKNFPDGIHSVMVDDKGIILQDFGLATPKQTGEKPPKDTSKADYFKIVNSLNKDLVDLGLQNNPRAKAFVAQKTTEGVNAGQSPDEIQSNIRDALSIELDRVTNMNAQAKAEAEKTGFLGFGKQKPARIESFQGAAATAPAPVPWYQQPIGGAGKVQAAPGQNQPPAGAVDTGRTSGGKKVYQLPDGNYWMP
jgi:hypothetical protein